MFGGNLKWFLSIQKLTVILIYPKYSKHYLLSYTIDFDCCKMLNHGLNHELFLLLFKFVGWKNILNSIANSGLNIKMLYSLSS